MDPRITRLINGLSRAIECIKDRERLAMDPPEETFALYTLLYVSASFPFYKAHTQPVPFVEFSLLALAIQTLPNTHPFLPQLARYFINVNDMLDTRFHLKKPSRKRRYNDVYKVLSALDASIFPQILDVQNSKTATYVNKKFKKEYYRQFAEEEFDLQHVEEIKPLIQIRNEALFPDKNVLKNKVIRCLQKLGKARIISILEQLLQPDNQASPDQSIRLIKLILNALIEQDINHDVLYLSLHMLCENHTNKAQFTANFLQAYKNTYNAISENNASKPSKSHDSSIEKKAILLKDIANIFNIFDRLLPPDQLRNILKDTNFHFEHPEHPELRTLNTRLEVLLSFYEGAESNIPRPRSNISLAAFLNTIHEMVPQLNPSIKILGRAAATSELRLDDPAENLPKLPLFMRIAIGQKPEDVRKEMARFVEKFYNINQRTPSDKQDNPHTFFFEYHNAIMQMINIMGKEGIFYMNALLGQTVLPLERKLKSTGYLPAKLQEQWHQYFKNKGFTLKNHRKVIEMLLECLSILNTLQTFYAHKDQNWDTFIDTLSVQLENSKAPQILRYTLIGYLVGLLFNEPTKFDIKKICKNIKTENILNLAQGLQNTYFDKTYDTHAVFAEMLKRDLTAGDINDFLHNTTQQNETGKRLAGHNAHISNILKNKGINPATSLHYKKCTDVIFAPDTKNALKKGNALVRLWHYLNALKQIANPLMNYLPDEKNKYRVQAIIKAINGLEKIINKVVSVNPTQGIAVGLTSAHANSLINKIENNLREVIKHIPTTQAQLPAADPSQSHKQAPKNQDAADKLPDKPIPAQLKSDFIECCEKTLRQLKKLGKLPDTANLKQSLQPKNLRFFRFQMWDKTDIMTNLLGNTVNCCLATNNKDKFSGMVQRRQDDAMLIPVAIDQKTGKVVALIWLYLAILENKNEEIALIANFIEMKAQYTKNGTLRKSLINGLLGFVYQYMQDTGIKHFYMNQLNYGSNTKDLDAYRLSNINIADKLGGAFIPSTGASSNEKNQTSEHYFLESLRCQEFHKFTPEIHAKNAIPGIINKNAIIHNALLTISRESTPFDTILKTIIKNYYLELNPFYTKPLHKDLQLAEDIKMAMHTIEKSRPCVSDTRSETARNAAKSGFFKPEKKNSAKPNTTSQKAKPTQGDPSLRSG